MKKQILYIIVSIIWAAAVGGVLAQDSAREVRAMASFEGRLWGAPRYGTGLVRFENGAWKSVPDAAAGLPDPAVTALAAVHGRLYAGTAQGLAVWTGSSWTPVSLPVSGTMGVTALAADGEALMIATMAGLFRLDAPGGTVRLHIGTVRQAASERGSGVSISGVRVFPPPGEARTAPVRVADASEKTTGAGTADSQKEPAWWTKVKKPARPQPTYFKDILPVMVKECLPCHTDGPGKYFPLNDPQTVIRYFRQGGLARFEQFLEKGGGMDGKVAPQTAKMIHIWVVDGCRE